MNEIGHHPYSFNFSKHSFDVFPGNLHRCGSLHAHLRISCVPVTKPKERGGANSETDGYHSFGDGTGARVKVLLLKMTLEKCNIAFPTDVS